MGDSCARLCLALMVYRRPAMTRRLVLVILGVGLLGFGGLQLLPFGRQPSNPPVTAEPAWPDPSSRALAARACFDCHSNESVWPW